MIECGITKKELIVNNLINPTILEDVLHFAQRASTYGLVSMAQGNVSGRDSNTGYIAITPHEFPYDDMKVSDIVIVNIEGEKISGNLDPSFETPVHCAVYRSRPEVMAIVHTEPPYVNAFGAVHIEIQPITTTLYKAAGGPIPVMPYRRSGSLEFANEMLKIMGGRNAIVWANHGMLVVGPSVEVAYHRSVAIEQGAYTLFLALQLGKPKILKDFTAVLEEI